MTEEKNVVTLVHLAYLAHDVARWQRRLDAAKQHLEWAALALYVPGANKTLLTKANGRAAIAIAETHVFPEYEFGPDSDALNWFKKNHPGAAVYDWKGLEKLAGTPDIEGEKAQAVLYDARQRCPQFLTFRKADFERIAKQNALAPVRPTIRLAVKYSATTLMEVFEDDDE